MHGLDGEARLTLPPPVPCKDGRRHVDVRFTRRSKDHHAQPDNGGVGDTMPGGVHVTVISRSQPRGRAAAMLGYLLLPTCCQPI